MAKNKFGSLLEIEPGAGQHERREKRGVGRPVGKRGNPAFKQYTVLMRIDTHDRIVAKMRRTMVRPDFGEYVQALAERDLSQE